MIKIQQLERKKCWLCGNEPNSKEHRHKKTDVKHIFENKFEGEPIIIKDHSHKKIQGSDSKLLKLEKVLCQDCNNNRSQPFDRAYDLFINYVLKNYDKILDTNILDFNEIVQDNTLEFKHNVLRYLTKAFCCRLATNNISITSEIIQFLNYKNPINFLYYKFEVRPDIHAFLNRKEADEYEGNIYL
jgi:hypothetical protein